VGPARVPGVLQHSVHVEKEAVIAVGRTSQVLIAPLREINSLPIRPLNLLSNGVLHMQIN